ncbi:hypothetical protein R5R35_011234 [Gryllus longicercus]|uniref:G-patch domain-containing protein n=1 Tax=Gryllus longicercus TaxID=2509291 RepID=A0AAN9V7A0_9ORTH
MKKISFSFSKSKPVAAKPKNEIKKDIQFIDCIESNAIKIKGGLPPEKEEELIIPVKADTLPKKEEVKLTDGEVANSEELLLVTASNSSETLEDIAVREILEDSRKVKEKNSLTSTMVLPAGAEGKVAAAEESTLADYENIPVTDFGLAMLRGMGWKPDKGIGKNEKIVEPTYPSLRPKGMGLGAEKRKIPVSSSDESEDLTLKKGAFVQVLAGCNKNTYGEVQSFDEEAGRVIIKTALGGANISVNENVVQVVPKAEYKKSSRVINQSQYDEYKRREERQESRRKEERNELRRQEWDNSRRRDEKDDSRRRDERDDSRRRDERDESRRRESRLDTSDNKRYKREDHKHLNGKHFSGE